MQKSIGFWGMPNADGYVPKDEFKARHRYMYLSLMHPVPVQSPCMHGSTWELTMPVSLTLSFDVIEVIVQMLHNGANH